MNPASISPSSTPGQRRGRASGRPLATPHPRRTLHAVLPVSLLDDARRRVKANMQAIERRLRLEAGGSEGPATEPLLTSLQEGLAATAARHRDLCRAGHFDRIDVAVYLRRVTSALTASMGRGPETETPESGGWAIEESRSALVWKDGSRPTVATERQGTHSLDEALQFVPRERREAARRAVCAVAAMFPPTLFTWTAPDEGFPDGRPSPPAVPGQVCVRLGIVESGLEVEIGIAQGSLGLPPRFEMARARHALEHSLGTHLDELVGGTGGRTPRSDLRFTVKVVSNWAETAGRTEGIEVPLAS